MLKFKKRVSKDDVFLVRGLNGALEGEISYKRGFELAKDRYLNEQESFEIAEKLKELNNVEI